jgi:hypothetical protein
MAKPTLSCTFTDEFGTVTTATLDCISSEAERLVDAFTRFMLACGYAQESIQSAMEEWLDEYSNEGSGDSERQD